MASYYDVASNQPVMAIPAQAEGAMLRQAYFISR